MLGEAFVVSPAAQQIPWVGVAIPVRWPPSGPKVAPKWPWYGSDFEKVGRPLSKIFVRSLHTLLLTASMYEEALSQWVLATHGVQNITRIRANGLHGY